MKQVFFFGILVSIIVKFSRCLPYNSSGISQYAKVATWSRNNTNRAYKSGNIWNHRRLEPKSISTTKKNNPSVVYQYPVYQRPESKIDKQTEHVPGIGEVIVAHAQDRFEARPLFAYKNKVESATYGPPIAPKPAPTPSGPVSPPSRNLYNSPYSSYNPPEFRPDDGDGDLYPPNVNSAATESVSSTENPKPSTQDSYGSLGPPLANHDDNGDDDQIDYGSDDHQQDPMAMYKHHDQPPPHPPKSVDDVYYPPDFPRDQIPGDGMEKEPPEDMMPPPESQGMMPPPDIPDGGISHGHAFPQYLYDHHHYDHHVYEEVPHTMAPEKEDKRVSSVNYSYYYLGRKLWYIPLYFSIYFIIYVTVLILKSIARHKVRLKYKWYEHDTGAKQARSMDLGDVRNEEISYIHRNVSEALTNTTAKYGHVLSM